jgi:hypothetical protein
MLETRWVSADPVSREYRRANRKTSYAVPAADHTDASIETPAGRSLGRYLASHLGSTQVSRVIYGSIIGLALVVALEAHPPPPGAVIATLVGSAIAVALAELYSELVGLQVRGHGRAGRAERRHLRADIAAVTVGVAFPTVFFILAAAGVFDDGTAFTVAKWSGLGLIGVYGCVGARVSGASLPASLLQGSAVALIGAFLIALKALVH